MAAVFQNCSGLCCMFWVTHLNRINICTNALGFASQWADVNHMRLFFFKFKWHNAALNWRRDPAHRILWLGCSVFRTDCWKTDYFWWCHPYYSDDATILCYLSICSELWKPCFHIFVLFLKLTLLQLFMESWWRNAKVLSDVINLLFWTIWTVGVYVHWFNVD